MSIYSMINIYIYIYIDYIDYYIYIYITNTSQLIMTHYVF